MSKDKLEVVTNLRDESEPLVGTCGDSVNPCNFWSARQAGTCCQSPEGLPRNKDLPICILESKRRIALDALREGMDENHASICLNFDIPVKTMKTILTLREIAGNIAVPPIMPGG